MALHQLPLTLQCNHTLGRGFHTLSTIHDLKLRCSRPEARVYRQPVANLGATGGLTDAVHDWEDVGRCTHSSPRRIAIVCSTHTTRMHSIQWWAPC